MSDFAKEILPSISSQLISKDENIQNEAALVVKNISKQCNNNDSIKFIIKHLFDLLNGSQGKLSITSQKFSVLTAIGNCSSNQCFSNSEILLNFIELIGEFLKTETHDGTLLFCLEQLCCCFKNLQTNSFSAVLLTKLKDFFKKLLENKTYTPAIRTTVFNAMISVYSSKFLTF